jgi:hypothetical protein
MDRLNPKSTIKPSAPEADAPPTVDFQSVQQPLAGALLVAPVFSPVLPYVLQPALPPVLQTSTKRGHDTAEDDDEDDGLESKIIKSSLKLKKFDGCFVCQFCDKVICHKGALGKHQNRGKWGYRACEKMQEHDKWVPADCQEHRWVRDIDGKPVGPVDPDLLQRLHAQRDTKRQADRQAANAAGDADAAIEADGVVLQLLDEAQTASEQEDVEMGETGNFAFIQETSTQELDEIPTQDCHQMPSISSDDPWTESHALSGAPDLVDKEDLMQDAGEDDIHDGGCDLQPGGAGSGAKSTAKNSPAGGSLGESTHVDGDQASDSASEGLDDITAAPNLTRTAIDDFSAPRALFGSLDSRKPATKVPSRHTYTSWDVEMET